ncbi:regulator of G-protein signaling 12-like [Oncorhynchus tshawytscha]|uniref:regulator of G-protein signaling 12-like n=1 Tax=Oncorhynchus tshawytscha TaxID=74940 RepID=UPI001C3C35A5|nr:regulator of G-protein signaling 12-like [Oncorhynchus tshawytscha]
MFKEQQLQIFNLMKFDSYTRFLKSLLYQECMLAEVEGRPLPDPYHIPSSPTSKHSTGSDRSTPKKEDKKTKSGRSLNEERERDECGGDKKKGMFFSWSRNRSFGKGPKKRDLADINYNFSGSNGRRESQGSLSSGASLELGTSRSGKNEGGSMERDRERGGDSVTLRQCNINLPDGTSCSVPVRAGFSIRELLVGLCEKLCINVAAVDLFLVGGEKPLVLDQDCMTLCSRDLRLEKRTLFRLDLVPINRSVGLKAKPTKPVTEVLRPVVAKYGLQLNDLVARISGEKEPLDLGLPISNLDGLRVVLDVADNTPGKDKPIGAPSKTQAPPPATRNQSATPSDQTVSRDERASGKPSAVLGNGNKPSSSARDDRLLPSSHRKTAAPNKAPPTEKRKQKKITVDEAEELFQLISKAQCSRADDQRGLLDKSDLTLPDFLRLSPSSPPLPPACVTQQGRDGGNHGDSDNYGYGENRRHGNKEGGGGGSFPFNTGSQSQSLDSSLGTGGGRGGRRALLPPSHHNRPPPPFPGTTVHPPSQGQHHLRGLPSPDCTGSVQMLQEEPLADLTLVGEGDINSPNSTLLTPHHSSSTTHNPPRFSQHDLHSSPCSGQDRRDGDQRRERDRGGRFKSHQKRAPPPLSKLPPAAPAPPRSRKSKSPSRPNRARLDVDRVETNSTPEDSGRFRDLRDSKLGQNREGVASELCRGGRVRTGVYQTSELPSLVSAKRQPEQRWIGRSLSGERQIGRSQSAERQIGRSLSGERQGAADRSRFKATFV